MSTDSSKLYKMVVSQLMDDGHLSAAHAVAAATMMETEQTEEPQSLAKIVTKAEHQAPPTPGAGPGGAVSGGRVELETKFITTHKGFCRVACFSPDGMSVATGSDDTSLKLLDVSKMKHAQQQTNPADDLSRPVTRTFYAHTHPVHCLAFHPSSTLLASGGADHSIHLFDTVKVNSKRPIQSLQDTHSVNALAYHPGGEFLLAGTDHGAPHLYLPNKHTKQCFLPPAEASYHSAPVTGVQFAPDGSVYASCSSDGTIKLWDGASSALVAEMPAAHDGSAVHSIVFSKDGQQLLSCGADSQTRLWDVNSAEQVASYQGAAHMMHPANSCWDASESFVFSHDEATNAVVAWDVRTGEMLVKKRTEHKNVARCVMTSPTERCLITCSDDFRARFWVF